MLCMARAEGLQNFLKIEHDSQDDDEEEMVGGRRGMVVEEERRRLQGIKSEGGEESAAASEEDSGQVRGRAWGRLGVGIDFRSGAEY